MVSKKVFITDNEYSVKLENNSQLSTYEISKFIRYCFSFLKISAVDVTVNIENERNDRLETLASYMPYDKTVTVLGGGRHILDVFRSLAHELVHVKQDTEGGLDDPEQTKDNNDGVAIENEANSLAGVIMRKYGRENPNLY